MKITQKTSNKILYHTLSSKQVLNEVSSNISGLNMQAVDDRTRTYGKNQLKEGKKKSIIEKLFDQFKDVMIIILLVASVISGFLGEFSDTAIILFVVILNAILGVIQESKAERALEALKKMSTPYAKVKRDNKVERIKSEDIVPGDIVLLEAGDFVPADIRLLEAASLKAEESALTGESVPVEKQIEEINDIEAPIADRKNMVYMGSSITYGRGIGVVVSTGMNTEVGKIADLISTEQQEQTPLQKKLVEIGKYISIGVIIIAIIIFIAGILEGREIIEMFLVAISLAVAAIPEGLPAVVTIVLAIGVQKMAKQNAIIRKLPAVETLGSTQIICSDKTGTLTQNKMTVKKIFYSDKLFNEEEAENDNNDIEIFLQVLSLCNDSNISIRENGSFHVIGDPTETALIDFSISMGFYSENIKSIFPRKNEIPFDSVRKLMTTINEVNGNLRVMTKGATDILLDKCSKILINGNIETLNEEHLKKIKEINSDMAGQALRVLGIAYRDLITEEVNIDSENIEKDLIFVGLVGMIDPPREEVKDAVRVCKEAGIRPIMITGDHRDTAAAIAKELNIIKDDSEVITGKELDKISDEDFNELVKKYSVYARVSPENKVRIVEAWKKNGKIVAMTGDGVNDAPALKIADIGVGMGITGTDVAKNVSDMVLSDDNFATIILAVEEGRKIYSNIRKAIHFLLSSNMGEVITLFVATMLNWTILYPIHILWINLVTDSLPALALGMENAQKDVMKKGPRKSSASFISEGIGVSIIYQGILQGLISLTVYTIGIYYYKDKLLATTLTFQTLGLIQLAHAFNVRSEIKSLFSIGVFSNVYLIVATIISVLLQTIVVLIPALQGVFRVHALNFEQWCIVLIATISIIPLVEVVKFFQRRFIYFNKEK